MNLWERETNSGKWHRFGGLRNTNLRIKRLILCVFSGSSHVVIHMMTTESLHGR
jgi:hypothetical protein